MRANPNSRLKAAMQESPIARWEQNYMESLSLFSINHYSHLLISPTIRNLVSNLEPLNLKVVLSHSAYPQAKAPILLVFDSMRLQVMAQNHCGANSAHPQVEAQTCFPSTALNFPYLKEDRQKFLNYDSSCQANLN